MYPVLKKICPKFPGIGTYLNSKKFLFIEFIDIWLSKYAEKNLSPKTLDRYKKLLKRIISPLCELKPTKPNLLIY